MNENYVTMDKGRRIEVICWQILPGILSLYDQKKITMEYAIEVLDRNMKAAADLQHRIGPEGDKYNGIISEAYADYLKSLGLRE